jgi:F-type H+-transporting ATPase subunit alpha
VDDLPASQCGAFERALYDFLDTSQAGLLQSIQEKKTLDDALRNELHKVLKEFKQRFTAEHAAR